MICCFMNVFFFSNIKKILNNKKKKKILHAIKRVGVFGAYVFMHASYSTTHN